MENHASKKNALDNPEAKDDPELEKEVDYDELMSAAGEFGRYQVYLFFLMGPFYIFCVFSYFSQLFLTEVSPNHWCRIPELANLTPIERRELAIPTDNSIFGYSRCTEFVANWTEVLASGIKPNDTWETRSCQHGWEFNKTEMPYETISSELGWVCDKGSYQATAQAIFFVGSIIGGFIVGWIADRFGRLPAIVFSNLIGCVAGFASTFAQNFLVFSICRFFMGMSYDNCMMMIYILVLEYVAPKYRTIMANLSFSIFFTIGVCALPWIALVCNHWKITSLVTSIPLALAALTPFIAPESPRWLLSKGRYDEAIEKAQNIGKVNKKEIPMKLIEQFKLSVINSSTEQNDQHSSVIDLLKRPLLCRMLICMSIEFFCTMIVYDSLVRTIGQLEFDFFVSFTIISFTEFPSLLLLSFVLDWFGRKWLTILAMSVCGIFSLITPFVGGGLASVLCSVVARFGVNMVLNACMQWAAEMFPVQVRGTATAIVHVCGFTAMVISPYVPNLNTIQPWLPSVLVGCISIFAALLCFLLPETANKVMPQTFEDAEELMRSQAIWDMPCIRNKSLDNGHVNSSFEMS